MEDENKTDVLVNEIERIKHSLTRSEINQDKKVKKLNAQLRCLEEAVKILKSK